MHCQWQVIIVTIGGRGRSEEHTSELQALTNHLCRLLLEKKMNGVTDAADYVAVPRRTLRRWHARTQSSSPILDNPRHRPDLSFYKLHATHVPTTCPRRRL